MKKWASRNALQLHFDEREKKINFWNWAEPNNFFLDHFLNQTIPILSMQRFSAWLNASMIPSSQPQWGSIRPRCQLQHWSWMIDCCILPNQNIYGTKLGISQLDFVLPSNNMFTGWWKAIAKVDLDLNQICILGRKVKVLLWLDQQIHNQKQH